MTHDSNPSPPSDPPSDVCLLLRAHAEQRWLNLEVAPLLRQLQQPDFLPQEQLGAALAYLEVLWIDASQRAAETDTVYAQLEASQTTTGTHTDTDTAAPDPSLADDRTLPSYARRYHAAVRTLRTVLGRQVASLLATPNDISTWEHANS
jgi:hypothetical protein